MNIIFMSRHAISPLPLYLSRQAVWAHEYFFCYVSTSHFSAVYEIIVISKRFYFVSVASRAYVDRICQNTNHCHNRSTINKKNCRSANGKLHNTDQSTSAIKRRKTWKSKQNSTWISVTSHALWLAQNLNSDTAVHRSRGMNNRYNKTERPLDFYDTTNPFSPRPRISF